LSNLTSTAVASCSAITSTGVTLESNLICVHDGLWYLPLMPSDSNTAHCNCRQHSTLSCCEEVNTVCCLVFPE